MDKKRKLEYYQAMLEKNKLYEGTFFVGITSTGIFCHSTCPARKPKFENCEFFSTAKQALLAGYRPCKRCSPLSNPNTMSPAVKQLVRAVEEHPEKRWKEGDFAKLSTSASAARRQFKKRFGMTFVEYARARRMGIALKEIKSGNKIIDAQIGAGYESDSGFRDAFKSIMGSPISKQNSRTVLLSEWIDTKLGAMLRLPMSTTCICLNSLIEGDWNRKLSVCVPSFMP